MAKKPLGSKVLRSGTVALLGRPNVGKSTLLNAALGEPLAIVTPTPQTTRDRMLGVMRRGDAEIALIDTPGLHQAQSHLGRHMNRAAQLAAQEADALIYVIGVPARVPASHGLIPHEVDIWHLEQLRNAAARTVIAINKIDRLAHKPLLLPCVEKLAALGPFAAIVPISALERDGLDALLDATAALLPQRGAMFAEDFLTDRPLRFFAAEYVREQVICATRQEVPHHVAVTIDRFDESGRVVRIDATIHCAREGQKPILIGKKGLRLKQVGISARARIEALLGRQIALRLHVCVNADWPDSAAALRGFGYTSAPPVERT